MEKSSQNENIISNVECERMMDVVMEEKKNNKFIKKPW
jgi:hypothetical protein